MKKRGRDLPPGSDLDGEFDFGAGVVAAVDVVADEVAEGVDDIVVDRIEDLVAAFFAGEDAGVVENAELFGDIGLGGSKLVNEFIDAFGSGHEGLKNGQPGGFGEDTEEVGDTLEGIAAERFGVAGA